MILNLIAYLIIVSTLVYAIQHTLLDYETYKPIIWINLALVAAALAVPLAHRINDVAGALLIVVAEWAALLAFAMYLGHAAGVQLQYFVGAAAPFVVFGLNRLWLVIPGHPLRAGASSSRVVLVSRECGADPCRPGDHRQYLRPGSHHHGRSHFGIRLLRVPSCRKRQGRDR